MADPQKMDSQLPAPDADTDLPNVAALRAEVQRLLLERARLTKAPVAADSLATEVPSVHISVRPDTPPETVSAISDVLARVMNRLRQQA